MFRTRMTMMDRLGMAIVGARILAATPFLESQSRIAQRVRANLDTKLASYLLKGVGSKLAANLIFSPPSAHRADLGGCVEVSVVDAAVSRVR